MQNRTTLLRFYLFISGLIVLNSCLYTATKMSFTGYWSDRVIFWIWLLATPFVVIIFWKKLLSKIYFGLLVLVLILSILPMGLPFFAILFSGSGGGRMNHFNLENNIRVQTVGYGMLGTPRVEIVKDGWLFDKIKFEERDEIKKNDSTWFQIRDARNAELISETDTSITIKYFFDEDTVQTIHSLKKSLD